MAIGFKCTTPGAGLGMALVSATLAANAQAQAVQAAPPTASTTPTAPTALQVLVNPGDTGEQSRVAQYGVWKLAVEQALRRERITSVNVRLSNDATADLGMTRAKSQGIFIAPAHVIGSAVRYGYTPVLGLDKPVQAVLVAPRDSGIDSLARAAGKRLGMPLQDSVVTYLLRGEVNAANTTIKRHFGTVYNTRYQEALLPCLQIRLCDVVVVERAVYERWVAAGEKLKVVLESKPVPGLGVAIRDGVRPGAEALRAALTEALAGGPAGRNEVGPVQVHSAAAFTYVSTLGYFTPRVLPGATVVDAPAVAQLIKAGATYIDTRTEAEFKAGHVPGARLVPYVEKSAKDADFQAAEDKFDIAGLGPDRNAPLIFACNGPECWKSFKASHAALKAGFTRVHWFRGGIPEWRSSGLTVNLAEQQ